MSKVRSADPNARIFYVYVLFDTRRQGTYKYGKFQFEYEPFYVGKGHGNRTVSTFKYGEIKKGSSFKAKKISRIKKDGYEVRVEVIFENLTEARAFELEAKLIKRIGRRDIGEGPLTNLTDGGEGRAGTVVSEKTKRVLSKKTKNHWNSLSDQKKEAHARKSAEAHRRRTPDQEAERVTKIVTTNASKSKKTKAAISTKKSKSLSATYAERGTDIMEARRQTIQERHGGNISNWQFMTDEDKAECRRKISQALRANPESEEQKQTRVAKMLDTWNAMDPDIKREVIARRNAASSKAWHAQTEEQKQAKAEKIRQGKLRYEAERKKQRLQAAGSPLFGVA